MTDVYSHASHVTESGFAQQQVCKTEFNASSINNVVDRVMHDMVAIMLSMDSALELNKPFQNDVCDRNILQIACHFGYTNTVRLLLGIDCKSFINTKDKYGFSALAIACMENHYDVVVLLLKAGAVVHKCEEKFISSHLNALGNEIGRVQSNMRRPVNGSIPRTSFLQTELNKLLTLNETHKELLSLFLAAKKE